jgi:hypothetical protein
MPVTSSSSVVMISLADICAAATCLGDEDEDEETPRYINSKFHACPLSYS